MSHDCWTWEFRNRHRRWLTVPLTVITLAALAFTSMPAFAQSEDSAAPQQWALLIGIEKYHRATQLRYTVNDVRQLADTLHRRGGVPRDQILEITDVAANPRFQPFNASLQAEIPEWLGKPGPHDQVLVYFSGHGFRDADGKLYLAPIDCDPRNPAATAIPVEWFREQIATCPAALKLLVIDACHAGSEKSAEDEGDVTAKDLGDVFQGLQKVVTLASSSADEKSQIWEDKQQSLFSYWLNQGLRGHADRDGDSDIDIDELYDYVFKTVSHTAEVRFPRRQTPKRIVRTGVEGVPTILRLRPQTLKELLADVADQLALAIEERRLSKVGVLEFTNDTRVGELLGADFGLLGRYCASELERGLMDHGTGKFSVVDRRRLQAALSGQQFQIADLGSGTALKQISSQVGGMPVIVLGTLRNRLGPHVTLQCSLVETEGDEVVGSAGGTAMLNESELAMLGTSFRVRPEDRRPSESVTSDSSVDAPPAGVVDRVDNEGAHPLLDPAFPFRVWLKVGRLDAHGNFRGEDRHGVFRGNDLFVPVRNGEVIHIYVENKSDQLALMRLLVDGLNTLPQRIENTVLESGQPKGVVTYQWGQPVNLSDARAWVLDPAHLRRYVVRGFVTETGKEGKLRQFTVVDADKSLAARQQFTDQLGIITAAFYAPSSTGRGRLGIAAGEQRTEDLTERAAPQPGNLLGVVHIRYVDADALGDAGDAGATNTGNTGAAGSFAQASAQNLPADACNIHLSAPDGATVVVDGQDRGTQRTFTWTGLQAERRYLSQFRIRFPGGGEAQRAVAVFGGRTATIAAHAPSRIVYSLSMSDQDGIYSIQPDGSGRRRITDGNDDSPALSPDGSQVLFRRIVEGGGPEELCVIGIDGRGFRQLIRDTEYDLDEPTWSPDGSQIVVRKGGLRNPELWVMNADGSDQRLVVRGARSPSWSPVEDRIAYRTTDGEIRTIHPDGSDMRRLVQGSDPAWSPDGARLAFLRGERLAIMDAEGNLLRTFPPLSGRRIVQRAQHTFWAEDPCWSPDGQRIAYMLSTNLDVDNPLYLGPSVTSVYTVNADGTGNRPLVDPAPVVQAESPDWR